jgi:hypothetical protein
MTSMTVQCDNPSCENFGINITVNVPTDSGDLADWMGVYCGPCGRQLFAGPAST